MTSQTDFTYTQLLKYFQDFTSQHKQLQGNFSYGEDWQVIVGSANSNYPALWTVPLPSQIQGNQLNLKFNFVFVDIMSKDYSDKSKIQSAMMSIALDFIAYLSNFEMFDIQIDETNIPVSFFVQPAKDNLAGFQCQITVELANYADYCITQSLINE